MRHQTTPNGIKTTWGGPTVRILRWTAATTVGTALAALPVVLALALLALARPAVAGALTDPTDAVVTLCAGAGALVLLWLAGTVVVATVDELRARTGPRRPTRSTPGVPPVVRRVVAVVVGILLGSAGLAANAAERGAAVSVPQAGWAVSAPVEAGWSAPAPLRDQPDEEHVVVRGDTLWSLAADRCGPDATPADVLAELQRLHTVNADVIGEDPDLLRPGQILRLV
jgi:hypothetical protein